MALDDGSYLVVGYHPPLGFRANGVAGMAPVPGRLGEHEPVLPAWSDGEEHEAPAAGPKHPAALGLGPVDLADVIGPVDARGVGRVGDDEVDRVVTQRQGP